MTRRRQLPLGLVVGFAVGFVLLVIGIVALFGLMVDERRLALQQLDDRKSDVEMVATAELHGKLADALATIASDVAAALADPLLPSDHLLLIEDGEQVLPRRSGQVESRARALLDASAGGLPFLPEDEVVSERLRLGREAATSYEAWLDHRARFVVPIDLDLAATLLTLEALDGARALGPERAEALMRGGIARSDRSLPGWLPALLGARARLSAGDFEHLLARGTALAKRSLVRVDDVLARARDEGPVVPAALLEPLPFAGPPAFRGDGGFVAGSWVAQGDGERNLGRRVDLQALVREVRARSSAPQHVAFSARVGDGELDGERLRLIIVLRVAADSERWDEARAEIHERFLFKAFPLGGIAALAVAVCALAFLLQRRRAAYLDLRSKLLAAVTHELKTPLASIRALAETLELRLGDHPGARDYPRRIVTSSERLGFLVDNVLSFARLERDAWRPQLQPLAVSDLASWLATEPVARAVRPIDLEHDVPAGLTLVGDPELVRLMLSNLLDNAAKYATAERVKVRLGARSDERGVHLSVSDDGPGLGVHDPKRLFEDFRRGHVEGVRGTGLGLSICRMVMALHGGIIEVAASSAAGTTFVATFPVLDP